MGPKSNSLDVNTILKTSIYSVNDANYASNHLPERYGILLTKASGATTSGYLFFQKFIASDASKEYTRIKIADGWSAWKSVSMT